MTPFLDAFHSACTHRVSIGPNPHRRPETIYTIRKWLIEELGLKEDYDWYDTIEKDGPLNKATILYVFYFKDATIATMCKMRFF